MPETPVPIGRRCLLGWANFWSMLAHCLPYDDSTTDPRAVALHTHPQTSLARKILAAITRESLELQ